MSKKKAEKKLIATNPQFITLGEQIVCLSTACAYNLNRMVFKFSSCDVPKTHYIKCLKLILPNGDPKTLIALCQCILRYTNYDIDILLEKINELRPQFNKSLIRELQ